MKRPSLNGLFGHYYENDEIQKLFKVLYFAEGKYTIEFFSFVTGEPSGEIATLTERELLDKSFRFYPNSDIMNEAYMVNDRRFKK